jgi:YggT family protein
MLSFFSIYLLFRYVVIAIVLFIIAAMALRLIFNYADPNPFGSIGKFSYWLKKKTDSWVRPSAEILGSLRMDTRIAPFLTMLGACIFAYFSLQLVYNVAFMLQGIFESLTSGRIVALIGYIIYGVLAIYSLLIVMRIVFSWFLSYLNPLQRFLMRVTDPILVPFRRIIPPIGMFDISPIIVLFLLNFLQMVVAGVLIS